MPLKKVFKYNDIYTFMYNKRAQFYLIAAIIIVVAIISVVSVVNYATTINPEDSIKIYEVSKELQLEGESVINHGIATKREINGLLFDFTKNYGQYVTSGESDVYFIYGDTKQIIIVGYVKKETGSISLDVGGTLTTYNIEGSTVESGSIPVSEDTNVQVDVGGTKYPFEIKKGQNFFFIVRQDYGKVELSPEIEISP